MAASSTKSRIIAGGIAAATFALLNHNGWLAGRMDVPLIGDVPGTLVQIAVAGAIAYAGGIAGRIPALADVIAMPGRVKEIHAAIPSETKPEPPVT